MHSHCKAVEEGCRIERIRGFRLFCFFLPFHDAFSQFFFIFVGFIIYAPYRTYF